MLRSLALAFAATAAAATETVGETRRPLRVPPSAERQTLGRNAAPHIFEIGSMLPHMPLARKKIPGHSRSNFPIVLALIYLWWDFLVSYMPLARVSVQLRTARRTRILLAQAQAGWVIHITATRIATPRGSFPRLCATLHQSHCAAHASVLSVSLFNVLHLTPTRHTAHCKRRCRPPSSK